VPLGNPGRAVEDELATGCRVMRFSPKAAREGEGLARGHCGGRGNLGAAGGERDGGRGAEEEAAERALLFDRRHGGWGSPASRGGELRSGMRPGRRRERRIRCPDVSKSQTQ